MKINTNSWHYKLYKSSFTYPHTPPETIDLCRYCHIVFWQIMLIGLLVAFVLVGGGLVLYGLLYQAFWLHPILSLKVVAIIALIVGAVAFYTKWLSGSPKAHATKEQGLVKNWLSARKEKVCPLLEFEQK